MSSESHAALYQHQQLHSDSEVSIKRSSEPASATSTSTNTDGNTTLNNSTPIHLVRLAIQASCLGMESSMSAWWNLWGVLNCMRQATRHLNSQRKAIRKPLQMERAHRYTSLSLQRNHGAFASASRTPSIWSFLPNLPQPHTQVHTYQHQFGAFQGPTWPRKISRSKYKWERGKSSNNLDTLKLRLIHCYS